MKKGTLVIAGGLLLLFNLEGACTRGTASADPEKQKAVTVRVATVTREDVSEVLSYVADLEPSAEIRIFSPVPDRITYFPWQDGQEIRRGQRVALVRKEGLDKGMEQMLAQMEALDVQISNLESELRRSQDLLAAGVITRQVFDQVQTSYLSARAQRKALEAGRGQLAVTVGNAVITAPISGVIAGRMLETGDMAVPQVPLCRILAVDRLKARLRLIEEDVHKVGVGQVVTLKLDAFPGRTFAGEVATIMPFLDNGTRTNTVEVTIDNAVDETTGQRALKPGMYGRAELVVAKREKVLVAPELAILLDQRVMAGQKQGEILRKAFVVDGDSKAEERVVRLGVRTGASFEILDGLAEGERVVVRGQHHLKNGSPVEVVTAAQ